VESATPRAMIRAMVEGARLSRPLLVPIVFSLGARLENVPLRAFLSNPTKIAGALRQLRGALALDGVICYFDPYLEVEALGGEVQWDADGASRTLRAGSTDFDTLRERVPSPGEIGQLGRVPVACEVVRRLKVMLPGEPALAVSMSGPRALAAQLTGEAPGGESVFDEATEFAAEVGVAVCRSFLDAGANVIFLREEVGAIQDRQRSADLLSPIVNVIRFYEALPVLLPATPSGGAQPIAASQACEGLICPGMIDLSAAALSPQIAASHSAYLPIQELLSSGNDAALITFLETLPPDLGLSLLTTQTDIAADTDIKRLASLLKSLQGGSRTVA